jgi:hypothetical protein
MLFHPILQSEASAPLTTPKQRVLVWEKTDIQRHAKSRLVDYGWAASQWSCLKSLWTKESNWRPKAQNKMPVTQIRNGKRVRLYAGGIPQILGLDPKLPAPVQVRKGMDYIDARYGSPCNAWAFWKKKAGHDLHGGWY